MKSYGHFFRSAGLLVFAGLSGCPVYTPRALNLKGVPQPPPLKTLPDPNQIVFLVAGDTGRGNAMQRRTGKLMAEICKERRPQAGCDFALAPGDLIYNSGVRNVDDPKFASHFEVPFSDLGPLPIWSVPGNHDWRQSGSVQAQIDYTAKSPSGRWRMPSNHFDVPGLPGWLHIYGLDTAVIDDLRHTSGENRNTLADLTKKQVQSAKEALCGKPGWRFLFGHHPVYSSGQHGREGPVAGKADEIHKALVEPLIKGCKVQIYFAGHDHMQEHLPVETEKFEQVIAGAVSEVRDNDQDINVPGVQSKFRRHDYGFALVTATRDSVRVEFFCFKKGENPGAGLPPAYKFELTL